MWLPCGRSQLVSGPTSQVSDLCRHVEPQVQKSPILRSVVNLKAPCIFTLQWSLQITEPFLLCVLQKLKGNLELVEIFWCIFLCSFVHMCLYISVDNIAGAFAIT